MVPMVRETLQLATMGWDVTSRNGAKQWTSTHFKNFNLSAGFGGEGYEGMICPGCLSGGGGGGIMVDGKAPNIIGANGCTLGCGLGYGAGGGGCSGFPQKGQPGVILIEVAN